MLKLKNGFSGETALVVPQIIVRMMEQQPLTSKLHITDIGFYPRALFHFRERTSPINQYVLIYCVDGAGWYSIGDTKYEVRRNQYFILPADRPHSYGADPSNPWTIYWIHFKGEHAGCYYNGSTHPVEISAGVSSRISNRIAIFEEIYNTLKNGYSAESINYVTSLFHYFLASLSYTDLYQGAAGQEGESDNVIKASIHYMKENLGNPITLSDIADYAGYSRAHFSKMFKASTGHPPLAYVNLLKIQQACHMLDNTDMKINQISAKIGVYDINYFSRLFTRIMGIPPREYRKQKKG